MDNSSASLVGLDGKRFVLEAGRPISLGRSADNDLIFSDKSISRHHATITIENGRCTIRDLGSQNGTFVSGRRVSFAEIPDGERVRFGDLELILSNPVQQPGSLPPASAVTPDIQAETPRWWRLRSVQATAGAAAVAVLAFAIVLLNRNGQRLDQRSGVHEQQRIGLASLTAGRSNFELPNASHDFVGDWAGTIRRTIPQNDIGEPELDEGIGFYEANGQVVMTVATYVRPGVTIASMKARALDPSHVVLEEEYVQKENSGQSIVGREIVEYSPVSAGQLDCKVTYTYYRDPRAEPFAKITYEGGLNRVSAAEAAKQTEAIKAKGFIKKGELQTRLPK